MLEIGKKFLIKILSPEGCFLRVWVSQNPDTLLAKPMIDGVVPAEENFLYQKLIMFKARSCFSMHICFHEEFGNYYR